MWYNDGMKHGLKVFIEHYKSKEHWYIKYITWGIISIVCFAILMQLLKEASFFANTPFKGFALNIFNFFDDWATALGAAVTLMLAGAAFLAIMDNRHGRMIDRREHLLNEIIEWATDVINCGFGDIARDTFRVVPEEDKLKHTLTDLSNKLFRYQAIDTRSKYIKEVTKVFRKDRKDLQTAVLAVVSCLNTVRTVIPKRMDNFEDKTSAEELSDAEHKLRNSAIALIELTANTKTKGIA